MKIQESLTGVFSPSLSKSEQSPTEFLLMPLKCMMVHQYQTQQYQEGHWPLPEWVADLGSFLQGANVTELQYVDELPGICYLGGTQSAPLSLILQVVHSEESFRQPIHYIWDSKIWMLLQPPTYGSKKGLQLLLGTSSPKEHDACHISSVLHRVSTQHRSLGARTCCVRTDIVCP